MEYFYYTNKYDLPHCALHSWTINANRIDINMKNFMMIAILDSQVTHNGSETTEPMQLNPSFYTFLSEP